MIFLIYPVNVINSDYWVEYICDSVYFESILVDKVPTMTSNTEPSGEAGCSGVYNSTYFAYFAFNGNIEYRWYSNLSLPAWIQYILIIEHIFLRKVSVVITMPV